MSEHEVEDTQPADAATRPPPALVRAGLFLVQEGLRVLFGLVDADWVLKQVRRIWAELAAEAAGRPGVGVTRARQIAGISRTPYYEWLAIEEDLGVEIPSLAAISVLRKRRTHASLKESWMSSEEIFDALHPDLQCKWRGAPIEPMLDRIAALSDDVEVKADLEGKRYRVRSTEGQNHEVLNDPDASLLEFLCGGVAIATDNHAQRNAAWNSQTGAELSPESWRRLSYDVRRYVLRRANQLERDDDAHRRVRRRGYLQYGGTHTSEIA